MAATTARSTAGIARVIARSRYQRAFSSATSRVRLVCGILAAASHAPSASPRFMTTGAVTAPPPRVLGFWAAVSIVMGNMIGSGVFLLPASLAASRGLSLAGWLLSAAGAMMLALVFA